MFSNILKDKSVLHGDRIQVMDVKRLSDLHTEIDKFKSSEELNGFQQWIVNDLYSFDIPQADFDIKSIFIVAVHHPFYANVELNYNGKKYYTRSLVRSDFDEPRNYIRKVMEGQNYHILETFNLPMKRLAVQSGLAVYGRNNITYVDTLGSNISYMAFFSDMPCERDEWREVCHALVCDTCNSCVQLCPTGAIRKERFLIDNQRCLSCINEGGGEFPEWLPKDVHHTLYDCLRCQEKCPMNKDIANDVIGPVCFSEEEISMIFSGKKQEDFSEEFNERANLIGLFDWPQGIARNIRAIMDR